MTTYFKGRRDSFAEVTSRYGSKSSGFVDGESARYEGPGDERQAIQFAKSLPRVVPNEQNPWAVTRLHRKTAVAVEREWQLFLEPGPIGPQESNEIELPDTKLELRSRMHPGLLAVVYVVVSAAAVDDSLEWPEYEFRQFAFQSRQRAIDFAHGLAEAGIIRRPVATGVPAEVFEITCVAVAVESTHTLYHRGAPPIPWQPSSDDAKFASQIREASALAREYTNAPPPSDPVLASLERSLTAKTIPIFDGALQRYIGQARGYSKTVEMVDNGRGPRPEPSKAWFRAFQNPYREPICIEDSDETMFVEADDWITFDCDQETGERTSKLMREAKREFTGAHLMQNHYLGADSGSQGLDAGR